MRRVEIVEPSAICVKCFKEADVNESFVCKDCADNETFEKSINQ